LGEMHATLGCAGTAIGLDDIPKNATSRTTLMCPSIFAHGGNAL